jgi:hypothetical protein
MASQKEQVAYVGMRWNDAAKYSAKARELRDMIAWIETHMESCAHKAAMVNEADRIEDVANEIRTQCESLPGWAEWKSANIDAMEGLQDWFANGAE